MTSWLAAALTGATLIAPASAHAQEGAVRLETSKALQRSAHAVAPRPEDADDDRSRAYSDGCLVSFGGRRSPDCVYGDTASDTTVILFGDSHALQYFRALEAIAIERGWRLVHLAKAGCPPSRARIRPSTRERYHRVCSEWRERALGRMRREEPALVVASGSTHYEAYEGSRMLSPRASLLALARGYVSTLERLTDVAPKVVVIRDSPRPPFDVPTCVAGALDRLRHCAFGKRTAMPSPDVITRAVGRVAGVTVVDPTSQLCPRRLCPAVIGDVLVWRNTAHLTATYAGTMARWLGRRLP